MNWNSIGGICAIIGVIFLLYEFFYLPKKEGKEAKDAFLAYFLSTRTILDNLISEIEDYAEANNYYYRNFTQGATFKKQLEHLIRIRDESLSDELLSKLKNEDLTKDMIALMNKGLHEQVKSFHQTSAYFRGNF